MAITARQRAAAIRNLIKARQARWRNKAARRGLVYKKVGGVWVLTRKSTGRPVLRGGRRVTRRVVARGNKFGFAAAPRGSRQVKRSVQKNRARTRRTKARIARNRRRQAVRTLRRRRRNRRR